MEQMEVVAVCIAISLVCLGIALGAMWMNVYDTATFKNHENMVNCDLKNGSYSVFYYGTGEMRIRGDFASNNSDVVCETTGWGI